jgi:hypothetical protein
MRPERFLTALLGAVLITTALAVPVMARDGDVIRSGACSGISDWKLKAGIRDGRIEVEFEVDQNRVGRQWRVRLTDNGDLFFRGLRTTQAPSGSFTVRDTTRNRAGDDRIVGRAVNLNSGEVCRGVVTV